MYVLYFLFSHIYAFWCKLFSFNFHTLTAFYVSFIPFEDKRAIETSDESFHTVSKRSCKKACSANLGKSHFISHYFFSVAAYFTSEKNLKNITQRKHWQILFNYHFIAIIEQKYRIASPKLITQHHDIISYSNTGIVEIGAAKERNYEHI